MASAPAHLGVLQIEPTDHCNLACRMCAPHADRWPSVHGVPKGLMDPAIYARILDRLVEDDCRFDHVILQWLGDPSLHPALEHLVALAGERLRGRIDHLRFDTNGILMGPDRMARLVAERAAGVPLLVVFTIDATTTATYRRTKGREGLEQVHQHVRRLLALRRHAADGEGIRVQVQFVVQPSNWGEAGAFLTYWEDVFACVGGGVGHGEILFKRLSVGGGAAGQAAADALYERTLTNFGIRPRVETGLSVTVWEDRPWQRDDGHATTRGPCPGLWFTPVVRHDGHLQMCCADLGGELDLGSLPDHGFQALWFGAKAEGVRAAHRAGRFEGVCAACGGINWMVAPEGDRVASPR